MRLSLHTAAAAVLPALCLAIGPNAQAQDARAILASAGTLTGKDAISEQTLVTIGGIPQWISVRGRHRGNPILLLLHGGPGFTLSPVSYYYMRDWEEYSTVVQWDQRDAGKTYAASDPAKVGPTLTIPRMVADAEELIGYLTRTYAKKRVVLMAHSFGTILGVEVAQQRPDLLYAYVGMGQFVDFQKSERLGYDATLADATAAGNAAAVADLRAIAPFPDPAKKSGICRTWAGSAAGWRLTAAITSLVARAITARSRASAPISPGAS